MYKLMNIPKFDLLVIDGDPLVYRAGFAVETINKDMDIIEIEPLSHAIYNINSMLNKTINKLVPSGNITWNRNVLPSNKDCLILGYLTASGDKTNFRYNIFPNYKANRKDARRPIYYVELRNYLKERYGANQILGQEADDSCSITHIKACRGGLNSVLCSIDKDFNNVAGWHYNYVTDDLYFVDEIQALRNKYLQILTGDTSDGIPRIVKGWRQKSVEEALQKALTEDEMYEIIYQEIKELAKINMKIVNWIHIYPFGIREWASEILARGRLVHLRHFEGELWEPNLKKPEKLVSQ